MALDDNAVTDLLAKQAITEALHRYCRAMDRMDNELGYSVFHEDASADYGTMFQGSGHGFIDFVYASHARMLRTSHQLGNILIRVEEDRAFSESYVTATFRMAGEDGTLIAMESHGRYLDRWESRGGRWAIAARRYVHLMDESWPAAPAMFADDGHRDRSDPSYAGL